MSRSILAGGMTALLRGGALVLLGLSSAACAEGPGRSSVSGSFSIAVEGGAEEQKRVHADFEAIESGLTVNVWELQLRDTRPWTVTLTLTRQMQGPPEPPPVGTYEIGYRPVDARVFSAVLVRRGNRDGESREYSTFHPDTGGTLTITESTDDLVSGTFEFTAVRDDGGSGREAERIVVSAGEFSARPR